MNRFALAVVAAWALIPAASAQFAITWYTIDGGGGTSSGGTFTLSGTIGQADAGLHTGGTFSLGGGFWNGISFGTCGNQFVGDSNCDGLVNFDDIPCFVTSLIDVVAWTDCHPTSSCTYLCSNDTNSDGLVNFDDIESFVICLINLGCP